MSHRVIILTAGFGEGHNAAARALAEACDERHGPGTARIVDAFALASPRLNRVARQVYVSLINRAPRVWSAFYTWLDRSRVFPAATAFFRREIAVTAACLESTRPAVVLSTYPLYGFFLADLARRGRPVPPHHCVVTDSISINSLWWRASAAGWYLPNVDSAEVLRQAGVPAERIHVSGFPVTRFFRDHGAELSPPDLSAGGVPRVLYIINSGTRHAHETARRLLAETGWEITIAVGRDEPLRRALSALAAGRARRATVLGWTQEIPRLLLTHHVVVSKAGGATTQEAIAARCPMIVNQIVPGQEEGNYELLRRHGIGALAETPDAVIAALCRAFTARGAQWHGWRHTLDHLARPEAAGVIVSRVLGDGSAVADTVDVTAPEPVPLPLRSPLTVGTAS